MTALWCDEDACFYDRANLDRSRQLSNVNSRVPTHVLSTPIGAPSRPPRTPHSTCRTGLRILSCLSWHLCRRHSSNPPTFLCHHLSLAALGRSVVSSRKTASDLGVLALSTTFGSSLERSLRERVQIRRISCLRHYHTLSLLDIRHFGFDVNVVNLCALMMKCVLKGTSSVWRITTPTFRNSGKLMFTYLSTSLIFRSIVSGLLTAQTTLLPASSRPASRCSLESTLGGANATVPFSNRVLQWRYE